MATPQTEKKLTLWDLLNDINFDKKGLYHQSDEAANLYNQYIFSLMLSQHPDALMIVNKLNCRQGLTNRQHHDYLFNVLTKRKRFAKLEKPVFTEDDEVIQKVYNYSKEKTKSAAKILTKEQVAELRDMLFTGGLGKTKKGKSK